MVDSPNDTLQRHKVSGRNSPRSRVGGQKSLENPENPEKLSLDGVGVGGYWSGWPLGDNSTYLQTFMVDSPRDTIQTHKVSGQKSPRGRAWWAKKT